MSSVQGFQGCSQPPAVGKYQSGHPGAGRPGWGRRSRALTRCSCRRQFSSFFPPNKNLFWGLYQADWFGNGLNAQLRDLILPVSIDRWNLCAFTMLPVSGSFAQKQCLWKPSGEIRWLCMWAHLFAIAVPSEGEFQLRDCSWPLSFVLVVQSRKRICLTIYNSGRSCCGK